MQRFDNAYGSVTIDPMHKQVHAEPGGFPALQLKEICNHGH